MIISLSSLTQPNDEEVKHSEPNTTAFVNTNCFGNGTLIVAKSRLVWVADSGEGFELEYPHISLHAVSRDLSNFHSECLFLMIDDPNVSDSESGESEIDREIRFVPNNKNSLEILFKSMSECQLLHPDPNDSVSDEEEDNEDENEENIHEVNENVVNVAFDGNFSNVYDVAAAEHLRGVPSPNSHNNHSNEVTDEPMDVIGQFEDAEPEH